MLEEVVEYVHSIQIVQVVAVLAFHMAAVLPFQDRCLLYLKRSMIVLHACMRMILQSRVLHTVCHKTEQSVSCYPCII